VTPICGYLDGTLLGQTPMDAADHHVRVEYCCPRCLASTYVADDAPRPHCRRCLVVMEPDSDEPPARKRPTVAGPLVGRSDR
jgi:ribosomal protein S27AE